MTEIRPGTIIDQVTPTGRRRVDPVVSGRQRFIGVQADPYIPPVDWSTPAVSSLPLLDSRSYAPTPSNMELAGDATVLPIIYGKRFRPGYLRFAQIRDMCLIVQILWGIGPITAIEELSMTPLGDMYSGGTYTWTEWTDNSSPMPFRYYSGGGEILYKNYLGTASQGVDPTMVASAAYWGQTYPDALKYVAYTVIQIPLDAMEYNYSTTSHPFPAFTAVIKGMKVKQLVGSPGSWEEDWSDCPAYCLADFITNSRYGAGMGVDWDEIASLADENNELITNGVTTEKRRTINLALDTPQTVTAWIETLRAYAGAIVYPEGEELRVSRDKPDPNEEQIILNPDNILEGSIKLRKRGIKDTPTIVKISFCSSYRSTELDANTSVYSDGLPEGRIDRRQQQLSLPGITSLGTATRLATRYLNDAILCDMTLACRIRDEGLRIRLGKLVRFAAPPYAAAAETQDAKWRIIQAKQYSPGRWDVVLQNFDWRLFSDDVVDNPYLEEDTTTGGGGGGGLPAEVVPDITGLSLTYELFEPSPGVFQPRLVISWNASAYASFAYYQVTARHLDGGTNPIITSLNTNDVTVRSSAVAPSASYSATVKVVSTTGRQSTGVTANLTIGAVTVYPYDVACTYNGKPAAGVDVLRFPFVRQVTFPQNLTGSYGNVLVAPTAQTDFTIAKNGSSVGTMRFTGSGSPADTAATFIFSNSVTFNAGDIMTVTAPSPADATLSGIGFCLKGTRL